VDIEHDDVRGLTLNEVERLADVRGATRWITVLGEGRFHEVADDRIVIDDKHSTAGTHVRSHSDPALVSKKHTQARAETNIDRPSQQDLTRPRPYGPASLGDQVKMRPLPVSLAAVHS
jgi:hypothetical protein